MSQKLELENYHGAPVYSRCPNCKIEKNFRRYIDSYRNVYVSDSVGICPSPNGCGYDTMMTINELPSSYISKTYFLKSLENYSQNNLFIYLQNTYGGAVALNAMKTYNIGTSKKYSRNPIFWEQDVKGNVHDGSIAFVDSKTGNQYNSYFITGNDKNPRISNMINDPRFNYTDCLVGEHLLNDLSKKVVIVKSELTAITSSCLYPEYLWLSTNEKYPSTQNLEVLKGREVFSKLEGWESMLRRRA